MGERVGEVIERGCMKTNDKLYTAIYCCIYGGRDGHTYRVR